MRRDYRDYLEDIIFAMNKSINFIEDINYSDFAKDDKTNSAVIRKLEIIGEAVKKIPYKIKKKYSQIPWKDIAGMRDKLIHEYFGVDLNKVWRTVKEDLPKIKPEFERILREVEENKTEKLF